MDLTPFYTANTVMIALFIVAGIVLVVLVFWNEKKTREHELALAQVGERTKEQKTSNVPMMREKETIVKEVVMVPCKYCQGLMPLTSVFCPNCGAARKA